MKTANIGGTFEVCCKEEKKNRQEVGEGCGSMMLYLYDMYIHI